MDAVAEIGALRALHPDAEGVQVAGRTFVFIPNMPVRTHAGVTVVDALLCPHQIDPAGGYMTRLYINVQVPSTAKANNWTTHQYLGRQWWTVSWQGVSADQAWSQILAAHLGAFA